MEEQEGRELSPEEQQKNRDDSTFRFIATTPTQSFSAQTDFEDHDIQYNVNGTLRTMKVPDEDETLVMPGASFRMQTTYRKYNNKSYDVASKFTPEYLNSINQYVEKYGKNLSDSLERDQKTGVKDLLRENVLEDIQTQGLDNQASSEIESEFEEEKKRNPDAVYDKNASKVRMQGKLGDSINKWIETDPRENYSISAFSFAISYFTTINRGMELTYEALDKNGNMIELTHEEMEALSKRFKELMGKISVLPDKSDKDYAVAAQIRSYLFDQTLSAEEVLIKIQFLLQKDDLLKNYKPVSAIANNYLCTPSSTNPDQMESIRVIDRAIQINHPHIEPAGEYKKNLEAMDKKQLAKIKEAGGDEKYFEEQLRLLHDKIFEGDLELRGPRKVMRKGDPQSIQISNEIKEVLDKIENASNGKKSWKETAQEISFLARKWANKPSSHRTSDEQVLLEQMKDYFKVYDRGAANYLINLQKEIFKTNWEGHKNLIPVRLFDEHGKSIDQKVPRFIVDVLNKIEEYQNGKISSSKAASEILRIFNKASAMGKTMTMFGVNELEEGRPNIKQMRKDLFPVLGFEREAKNRLERMLNEIIETNWVIPNKGAKIYYQEEGKMVSKVVPYNVKLIFDEIKKTSNGTQLYSEAEFKIRNIADKASHDHFVRQRDPSTQNFYEDCANGRNPQERIKHTLEGTSLNINDDLLNSFLNLARDEQGVLNDRGLLELNSLLNEMGNENIKLLCQKTGDEKNFKDTINSLSNLKENGFLNRENAEDVIRSDDPKEKEKQIIEDNKGDLLIFNK